MKVLLDANALVAQQFLKGHLGIALIHGVRAIRGKLVIPEFTLAEARHQTLRLAAKHREAISTATGKLQVLLGRRPTVEWPPVEVIGQAIDDHLTAIADIIDRPPFEITLAQAALDRVIKGRPPSHNSEQFRDALLWETASRLASIDELHFVTSDKDFLITKNNQRELHPTLAWEVANADFDHHLDIPSLLSVLAPQAQQPLRQEVANTLGVTLTAELGGSLQDRAIVIDQQKEIDARAFATADPNNLSVAFTASFAGSVSSSASTASAGPTISAVGSANLDTRTNDITGIDLTQVDIAYPPGSTGTNESIVWASARSLSTSLWTEYNFRHPIDPSTHST